MEGGILHTLDRWIESHPRWFEQLRFELEDTNDGWGPLIDRALLSAEQVLSELPGRDFRVVQIKEKFGALTIYFRENGMPITASARLREIMQEVRESSLCICEVCGASAHLGRDGGHFCVRCVSCAPKGWEKFRIDGSSAT